MKKVLIYLCVSLLIYLPDGNQLLAQATNKLDPTGNAGVGTISPTTLLQIGGTAQGTASIKGTSSQYPVFDLDNESVTSGRKYRFSFKNNASTLTLWDPTDGIDLVNYNADGSINFPTGNFGLGTTSPGAKLDIKSVNDFGSTNILRLLSNDGTEGIAFGFEDIKQTGSGAPLNLNANATGKILLGNVSTGGVVLASGGGNVGVGTASPGVKLDIKSANDFGSTNIARVTSNDGTEGIGFGFEDIRQTGIGAPLNLNAHTTGKVLVGNVSSGGVILASGGGYVGIGTATPSEKLSVNGNTYVSGNSAVNGFITAKKVTVTQTGWSDYVFDKKYKLRSLSSLEIFINQNKHLPEVPSAKEVQEKGISVGDNQALLLKKIEELTLYVIQQQKQIDELKKKIDKR